MSYRLVGQLLHYLNSAFDIFIFSVSAQIRRWGDESRRYGNLHTGNPGRRFLYGEKSDTQEICVGSSYGSLVFSDSVGRIPVYSPESGGYRNQHICGLSDVFGRWNAGWYGKLIKSILLFQNMCYNTKVQIV